MRLLVGLGIGALGVAALGAGCGKVSVIDSFPGTGGGETGWSEDCVDEGCGESSGEPPFLPHPSFGDPVQASAPPPPISGGTLLVLHDGATAVASDPDRDQVYVVDVAAGALRETIALEPGDEPGRLVEDASGRVHVALRGGRALATIDPAAGAVLFRRALCPAPRGVAYDDVADLVWAACATGELVALPAAGGDATSQFVLERDLRDVVIHDGALAVTTFRTPELLHVGADGSITGRAPIHGFDGKNAADVAWRSVGRADGSIVVTHQEASTRSIQIQAPSPYGGGGDTIVQSVVNVIGPGGHSVALGTIVGGVLPVDVAVSAEGKIAVVTVGNAFQMGSMLSLYEPGKAPQPAAAALEGQPIAVAFDAAGEVLVQSREPAALSVVDAKGRKVTRYIKLSPISRADTGLDVFYTAAGASLACASCHPEGGDDGRVWKLDGALRRTPSLRGTIAGTAPYHWTGAEHDLRGLVDDVYTRRMSGVSLSADEFAAAKRWIESIPAPPAASWVDPTAAARGADLFRRADVGCASCHRGAKLTDDVTVDVGTGRAFQVPSLVGVGWRAPFLHDGCAATFADRFGKCATRGHGDTSMLSASDLTDLEAYLETL